MRSVSFAMYAGGDLFVHQMPARRHADLALEEERAERAGRRRQFEIGVVEDDERRVSAEFERDALERPSGGFTDEAADLRRAGERDHVDVRIGTQRGARFGIARQHVQHAVGQPRPQPARRR